jgi:cellobiose phosphorylase
MLGSEKNRECKIDSIAQSWSVISQAGDAGRVKTALDSLNKYLVNQGSSTHSVADPSI